MRNILLMALVGAPIALSNFQAAVAAPQAMICPIGGASFQFTPPTTSPPGLPRPDGKPYGVVAAPPPIPECPDNGLVLYKDYTPEEVAKLEPLIASDAYQAMRAADTPYYRAYWLMREMGVGSEDYLWALLQASWQAEGKPELRTRYLTELAEASAKVPADPANLNWIGMEARAINAVRELGRFDEAAARLAKVPLDQLDVVMPRGQDEAALREARSRRAWLVFFKGLKPAIDRKDSSLEPFDLVPRSIALGRCIDEAAALPDFARTFCETESASVEQVKTARARLEKEREALRRSREASGR